MYKRNYLFLGDDLDEVFLSGACVNAEPAMLFTSADAFDDFNSFDAFEATLADVCSFFAMICFFMGESAKISDNSIDAVKFNHIIAKYGRLSIMLSLADNSASFLSKFSTFSFKTLSSADASASFFSMFSILSVKSLSLSDTSSSLFCLLSSKRKATDNSNTNARIVKNKITNGRAFSETKNQFHIPVENTTVTTIEIAEAIKFNFSLIYFFMRTKMIGFDTTKIVNKVSCGFFFKEKRAKTDLTPIPQDAFLTPCEEKVVSSNTIPCMPIQDEATTLSLKTPLNEPESAVKWLLEQRAALGEFYRNKYPATFGRVIKELEALAIKLDCEDYLQTEEYLNSLKQFNK